MISTLLYYICYYGIEVMVWLIIIRVFLSYLPHDPYAPIFRFIYEMTEPIMQLASRVLPNSLKAPLDFSPLVALLVLQFLVWPVLRSIIRVLPF